MMKDATGNSSLVTLPISLKAFVLNKKKKINAKDLLAEKGKSKSQEAIRQRKRDEESDRKSEMANRAEA